MKDKFNNKKKGSSATDADFENVIHFLNASEFKAISLDSSEIRKFFSKKIQIITEENNSFDVLTKALEAKLFSNISKNNISLNKFFIAIITHEFGLTLSQLKKIMEIYSKYVTDTNQFIMNMYENSSLQENCVKIVCIATSNL